MLPRFADLIDSVRLTTELVSARVSLPVRMAREPLDLLLRRLSGTAPRPLPLGYCRLIRQSERVIAHLPGVPNTCLYRALARYAVLQRRGVPVEFLVGLPRTPSLEPGHAWILVNGRPCEEDRELASRMAVTFRYPPVAGATSSTA